MILVLCLVLIAVVCLFSLLVTCATYALPLSLSVGSGLFAHYAGAGWLGTALVGALAATFSLTAGRLLLCSRSLPVRIITMALISLPAGLAGFYATLGITAIGHITVGWRVMFASIAAVVIAIAATVRLNAPSLGKTAQRGYGDHPGG